MTIQYFYDGISSVGATNPLGRYPFLDPTTWAVFMEDFIVPTATTDWWLHTTTNGTLASAATGGTGIITQTLAGADNDLSQLALKAATIAMTSGKKMVFEARVMHSGEATAAVAQAEIFVGLSTIQTAGDITAADGLTMTADNCIGFWSVDGSANIAAICRKSDVESIQTAACLDVITTWTVYSIAFDGTTAMFYKDDVAIASLTGWPTAAVIPTLYIKAGEAKIHVLSTDYVFVAVER